MNPRSPHPLRQSVVSWPAAIPRVHRSATDAGTGSLCFHHRPLLEAELFEERQIRLTINLLAVVNRGNLILRRGGETRVVPEGAAVLVPAGELWISEVSATAAHAPYIYYFCFDDRAVRRRFHNPARIEPGANGMAAPATELFTLPNFVPQLLPLLQGMTFRFPHDFTRVLNFTFNHGWAGAWMFLKGFLARRRELHLFLEEHVLPPISEKKIMGAYPGGARQFRRDYRAQYDVPLERWLTWRRLDLVRVRLRHGHPVSVEAAATWAGYHNFERFRQQFRARFGLWPEEIYCHNDYQELPRARQAQVLAPFWHWGYDNIAEEHDREMAFLHRHQYSEWDRLRMRRFYVELRQEAIDKAARKSDPSPPALPAVVQASGTALPPQVNVADFIRLEPFLEPKVTNLPLAA